MSKILDNNWLNGIFPPSRTDDFFDALFGGAEEGAYDIRLVCRSESNSLLNMAFELHQRPGKCLVCSLTYGLPQVFQRHPILNVKKVAETLAQEAGWDNFSWKLGNTEELSHELHVIPFTIFKA